MSDRATVFQGVQIGVETTPGTAVAATKRLTAMMIETGIKANIKTYRAMGTKYKTLAALGKEWSASKVTGTLTYTEIVYALSGIVDAATITTPGGGTLSRNWSFASSNTAADNTSFYSIQQGSANIDGTYRLSHKSAGNFFNEFGYSITRDEAGIHGALVGRRITDNAAMSTNEVQTVTITGTPTGGTFTLTWNGQTTAGIAYNASAAVVKAALELLSNIGTDGILATGGALPGTLVSVEFVGQNGMTNVAAMTASAAGLTGGTSPAVAIATTTPGVAPTEIALIPLIPSEVCVKYADLQASLGAASNLARVLSVDFTIADRFHPIWALDCTQSSFSGTVEGVPKAQFKVKMEANSEGMALLTQMRAGTKKFWRVSATSGTLIEGSIYYSLQHDLCGVIADVSEFSDADGVYAIEWTFDIENDATWGAAYQFDVVNTLTAL